MAYRTVSAARLGSLALLATLAPTVCQAAQTHKARFDTPNIVATVDLPKPVAPDPSDTGHIGVFTTGGTSTPIVVDAETKAKLDELAKTLQKLAADNYGLIIRTLKLEDKPAPCKIVHIVLTYAYHGVAATSWPQDMDGPRIEVSSKYMLAHPTDTGLIVHELVHVVQNYHFGDAPGWLVEGVADYIRWHVYEPGNDHTRFTQANANAKGAYRQTANFLDWVTKKYDKDLVPQINTALQADKYTDDIFKTGTGRSLDDLAAEWKAQFPAA